MIECRSLSYSSEKKQILSEINLTAINGEITVLLGPNGSGKTSLLRCISGIINSKKNLFGDILIDGINSTKHNTRGRSKILSLLPQTLPSLQITVSELVSYGRSPYIGHFGKLSDSDKKTVNNAIDRVSMTEFYDTPVSCLSGGERQLAFFAMLVAQNTGNVLLDEPTSSLDEKHRSKIFDTVYELKKENKTIIIILHDITEAVRLADKICVLDNGRSVFYGTPEQFVSSDVPEKIFGVVPYKCSHDGKEKVFFSRKL